MILKKEPKLSAANIPENDEVLEISLIPNCWITKTPDITIPSKDKYGRKLLLFGEIRSTRTINTNVVAIAISGLMKTKSDKGLLLPIKFKDDNSTDSRIKNFGRDVIIVFHFLENDYKLIQDFQEDLLAKTLIEINKLCPNFDYIHLSASEKMENLSKTLKEKLNRFSGLRLWAEAQGSSLLHLGTLQHWILFIFAWN